MERPHHVSPTWQLAENFLSISSSSFSLFSLDGPISSHLFEIGQGTLVLKIFYGAVTLSWLIVRAERERPDYDMNYILRHSHDYTNFVVLK